MRRLRQICPALEVDNQLRIDQSTTPSDTTTTQKMALTPVARVTEELKGQTVHLPNLNPFFSQWPTEMSPYYEQLKETIESKIVEWISEERVRAKARKIDLPLFSATWVSLPTIFPP